MLGIAVIASGYAVMLVAGQQQGVMREMGLIRGGRKFELPKTAQEQNAWQFKDTGVGGLSLAYRACPATFTGACDDAMLYRQATDGSKQVVISSLRQVAGAPQTNEMLQPLLQSPDGKYIVFGAWTFGSERNPSDKRVWIYKTDANAIVSKSSGVPGGAVFSPDYAYAAYGVEDNGDIRDIMIVSFVSDKVVSGAKADDTRSFKGPDGGVHLQWNDAKTLVISEFSIPSGAGASSVAKKTREITVKVK